jgi:hypothetical protein
MPVNPRHVCSTRKQAKKSATLGGVALNPPKEEGGGDNLQMLPEASNLSELCQIICALQ